MGLMNKILVKICEPNASARLEELLDEAREASKSGNFDYVSTRLNYAKQYAHERELSISQGELNYIKEIAGTIEFDKLIKEIKDGANEGYPPGVLFAGKQIEELAPKLGKKINEWFVKEKMDTAYKNGIDSYFKRAESSAKAGWVGDTWSLIYRARVCARRIGIDIQDREQKFYLEYPMATHPDMIAACQEKAIRELIEPCFFDD